MGKEDRMLTGSYIALREQEQSLREAEQKQNGPPAGDGYLPEFLK